MQRPKPGQVGAALLISVLCRRDVDGRDDVLIPSSGLTVGALRVRRLDSRRYQVAEIPGAFVKEFGYMDILDLQALGDGAFQLRSVLEPGGWCRFDCLVSQSALESEAMASLLARVGSAGGTWVRDFGGCLSIVLPPGSEWNLSAELKTLGVA